MNLIHTVFEPQGAGPHPTLLTLHGWGANALDLLGLAPYLCGGQFLMLCPQGPLQVPLGGAAVGYGWFPVSMGGPLDLKAVLLGETSPQPAGEIPFALDLDGLHRSIVAVAP